MQVSIHRVARDPHLSARITRRTPLMYRDGADPNSDRPAHVRAGSALAWVGDRLIVVQDDANFIALVDPRRDVDADVVVLPAGHEGKRQFDSGRGNKKHKLDLESCITIDEGGDQTLIAFGSGSKSARERIVVVTRLATDSPAVSAINATEFYASLRDTAHFAGARLNIEGAVVIDGRELRLFNRGNGARRDGREPVNASCTLDWLAFREYLQGPLVLPPLPRAVQQYELGAIDDIPLGFTDAIAWAGGVLFSAAAEASKDAIDDGRVAGSVIGVIPVLGAGGWARIVNGDGSPFIGKIEGIAAGPDPREIHAVADEDEPSKASEICIIALEGFQGL